MYYQKPNGKHQYYIALIQKHERLWSFNFKNYTIIIILWWFIPVKIVKTEPMQLVFKNRKPFVKEIRNMVINKPDSFNVEFYMVYKSWIWFERNKDFLNNRFTLTTLKYAGKPQTFIDCVHASFITLLSYEMDKRFNDLYNAYRDDVWKHIAVFKVRP